MHIHKKIFFYMYLFIFALNVTVYDAAAAGANPFANLDPNLSQEELLEQFMGEINQLIPEAERENFWQEVARETERLERETAHMSEEEKEKYLMNIITQPAEAAPTPPPVAPVIEEKPVTKEVKKPEVKKISSEDKVTELVNIITSIIKSIESLINKAAALPDFDGKIERWIRFKRVNDWPTGVSWATFQQDLHRFVHMLQLIKDKDIKIGYKHIESIIESEALLNNLRQLETRLSLNVPNIEVSVFAMAKMSQQTKVAINKSINALAEAMYKLQLPTELKKLMEKFEPIAKKIREEQEKLAKQAATPYAPSRAQVPVRVAGKREEQRRLPSLSDFDLGGSRGYKGSDLSAPGEKSSKPTTTDKGKSGSGSRATGGGGSRSGGGSGGSKGGATSGGKPTKEAPEDKKKGPAPGKAPAQKFEQDADVKRNLTDFGKSMQDAANALDLGVDSYTEDALRRHFSS